MSQTLDILAFAPHPDDAEICCGGLLAKEASRGAVGVIDLTQGELGTGGSVEQRQKEVEAASKVLGLSIRENLKIPDGGVNSTSGEQQHSDCDQLQKVVSSIRAHKPKVVLLPYWQARHPDHSATSHLVTRAVFFSGLKKYLPEIEKHTPEQVVYYQMRHAFEPSFISDISNFAEKKYEAISCFSSQIKASSNSSADQTLLNSPETLDVIQTKDKYYGSMIGTKHAEPYFLKTTPRIDNLVEFFDNNPTNKVHVFKNIS